MFVVLMYLMARCNLKLDKLEHAVLHIQNWRPETVLGPSCLSYEFVQESDNQTASMLFLELTDNRTHHTFLNDEQIKKFILKLDSFCVAPPNWSVPTVIGSIKNTKQNPSFYSMIKFNVRKDRLEETKSHISDFIRNIQTTQKDIYVYQSFQDDTDPLKFTHLMGFKDREAEDNHRKAIHTTKFTKMLFENCASSPKFDYLEQIRIWSKD